MTTWTSETTTVTEPQPTILPDYTRTPDEAYEDGRSAGFDQGYDNGYSAAVDGRPSTDRHSRWIDRAYVLAAYLALIVLAVAVLR